MDWLSVASLLAERTTRPVTLVDGSGRIRLLNGAMEQALGWRRYELEGRPWADLCVPPDQAAVSAGRLLDQALRGTLRRCECMVVTRDSRRLLFELEMSLVGRGREQGLLITADSAKPIEPVQDRARDREYQITINPNEFGFVKQMACIGSQSVTQASLRCFEVFHGRQAPCDDCPVLRPAREAWPRTVVRRRNDDPSNFEIITATPLNAFLAQVSVRLIAEQTLTAIQTAKIRALADAAGLSERERSVLNYLLMGRTLDDIATILQVSRSTVKFHQANILQKLGADSRVDLIRLTGF